MKANIFIRAFIILQFFFVQSCQPQKTKEFNLYTFDFSEKITSILNNQNIKLDTKKSEALTLFGYNRFRTNSSKLLKFHNSTLSGNIQEHTNSVTFHYSIEDKVIAIYEVLLFTKTKVSQIKKTLNSDLGRPHHSSTNSDGLEMNVWKNEKDQIYFFLMSYQDEKSKINKTEFTVIDMKNPRAKEWIDFRSFNYFL
ncbi:hypothetical protein [Aquimarina litoralis]|uniref:hypothetical protein n=1 Tax=Aquimarina litoralis TaxID=584605 RepID=UPI001C583876|nr:hypothetical protein [Aquimarina litoralis]MBW1296755.1 hypothetical protein [Aquimarina litoralis]